MDDRCQQRGAESNVSNIDCRIKHGHVVVWDYMVIERRTEGS